MKTSTLLFYLTLFLPTLLVAQNCASGWLYYRTITVDNSAGTTLADYQVEFTLNTAQLVADGKMQPGGTDLRVFSADCTPLPFWGDSLGTSTNTRIWVKVPNLEGGGNTELQVYYGRPEAETAADGDNTFIFFDDFDGPAVDDTKWEAVGEFATFETNNGLLRYASTNMLPGPRFKFARTKQTFAQQVIFDFVITRNNANGFGFSSADVDLDRFIIRDSGFGFDTLNQIAVMPDTISNGFATQNSYPILRFDRFVFNTVSITPQITAQNEFRMTRFANEGLGDENLDTLTVNNVSMTGFRFIVSTFGPSFTIEMDNIRVRQHSDNPPVSTVGEENMLDPNSVEDVRDISILALYPNPTADFVTLNVLGDEAVHLRLVDAQGRMIPKIDTRLLPGVQQTLDLRFLPAGLYFLQVYRSADGVLLQSKPLSITP